MRAGTLHTRIPEGQHGSAKVVRDTPDEFTRLRAQWDGMPLYAQKYTRLFINDELWMTDTEFECQTNRDFVRRASGDVLIAGLGIGLIIQPLLEKEQIQSVTVLERSADVIALIGPLYQNPKLTIVHADVKEWQSPKKAYDFIYFDIWSNVPNEDNKPEISALRKRYRSSLKTGGRSFAWCEERIGRRR